jgi:dihydropteroate synthase
MGIVNLNDDSFCGDGTLDVSAGLAQAKQMILDGADIIDIGAESARTNRGPITVDQEIARMLPFIEQWPNLLDHLNRESEPSGARQIAAGDSQGEGGGPSQTRNPNPLLSINTWRTEVVRRVLPVGGDILNDISALPTPHHAELCAEHDAALLIMHSVGQPKVPHTHVGYPDVMAELDRFFEEKIRLATSAGISPEQLILDPGIDFAKQRADNLRIYRDLDRLHRFQRPILLPVSRKTVIGDVLSLPDPCDRDAGTLACIAAGMRRGAHIFRVHNVAAATQAVTVLWEII